MTDFWANPNIEPKRKFRWVVYTDLFGGATWLAKKVTRPSWKTDSTVHQYLNHTFKYPGRVTWEDISLTIVDAGPTYDSTFYLYRNLIQSGYIFPENPNDRSTISKAGAVESLGQIRIDELSAAGTTIGRFILFNAWVQAAKLGELDYGSSDIVELTLTLTYDYAKFNSGN